MCCNMTLGYGTLPGKSENDRLCMCPPLNEPPQFGSFRMPRDMTLSFQGFRRTHERVLCRSWSRYRGFKSWWIPQDGS